MANRLNRDLAGMIVVLRADANNERYQELKWRIVRVGGGFGAQANTHGTSLSVLHLNDGERRVLSGWDVERAATVADLACLDSDEWITYNGSGDPYPDPRAEVAQ